MQLGKLQQEQGEALNLHLKGYINLALTKTDKQEE
jgi:hypothetical protein